MSPARIWSGTPIESASLEDKRRVSNGDQVQQAVSLALASRPSPDFCGYRQRHKAS